MAILRHGNRKSFTMIDNTIFRDRTLSNKALGMLCRMLSLPDGWDFSVMGLVSLSNDGKSAVMSQLEELESHGYLVRRRIRKDGKIAGIEYVVSEVKMSDFQDAENQHTENQHAENPPQSNTYISTTNISTTKTIHRRAGRKSDLHSDPTLRPTVEDIQAYIREKNLTVDAKRFFDYFDASEWIDSMGKPIRNWKQKLITWSGGNGNNNRTMSKSDFTTPRGNGDSRSGDGSDSEDPSEWFFVPGMETPSGEEEQR